LDELLHIKALKAVHRAFPVRYFTAAEIDEMQDGVVRGCFYILLFVGMPLTVFSQDPAAVLDLQSQIDQQAEQIAELQNLLDGKVDNGTSRNDVKLSGRIHADYWGFPNHDSVIEGLEGGDPQDRIGFRRIRFGVAGNIAPNMNYKIEMEFAGGNDSEFRDVYLGWRDLPVLGTLLLGNQKRPYGLDHINSSRYNVFVERPLVIESFNQDCRRFGLVSYNVTEDQIYNWRCGFYNKELMQNDGQAIGDHVQLEFAGRLAKTYRYEDEGRDYGHWAVSASAGAVDGGSNETRFRHRAESRSVNRWLNTGTVPDADHYELLGLEYARNKGPWQFVAEVLNLWMTTDADETVNYHGGYVYASFFLTGEHMPWNRSSGALDRIKPLSEFLPAAHGDAEAGMGAWQLAVRWSWADFSESSQIATQTDPTAFGLQGDALTVGLNWYWNQNAKMQFNWINGDITNAADEIGRYDIIGARFMVDF